MPCVTLRGRIKRASTHFISYKVRASCDLFCCQKQDGDSYGLQASLTQDTDRSRPTREGASRRPYAEAHAQVVPTALSTFQGSLLLAFDPTASRKRPAIVCCIRRVSEGRERQKDSGVLDLCARRLPST